MSKRSHTGSHGDEPDRRGRRSGHSARKEPSFGRGSGLLAESDTPNRRLRSLYLVVDDWERGYSIHRIDEDDFNSDDRLGARPVEPPPALVRLEAQHPHSWSFAAHGTKILAMHPSASSPGIPAFDTKTLGVTVCPYPRSLGDIGRRPLYASVGGRLLAFVYPFVDVLGPEPPPTDNSWSWTSIEPPPPFVSWLVSSYAVHPDGRTVFVSVKDWRPDVCGTVFSYHLKSRKSTFTFDMERLEWTHAGEWLLPFKGQAHYDRELDFWVGLCLYKEGAGRVCCCDVPPAAGCQAMPAWKLGQDVFFDARSAVHRGATLVYKGDSGFCMVESTESRPRMRVLKITSFVLKYDKDGDLRTTHHRAYASISYQIAHKHVDPNQNPEAFWV